MPRRRLPDARAPAHLALAAALLLGAGPAAADAAFATADLVDRDGDPAGTARFVPSPSGVLIEVRLFGLAPGKHAIHIHETGACEPGFGAAGGHFAPEGRGHGFLSEGEAHPGDLPNIVVWKDGSAVAHFVNARATLEEGPTALLDGDGSALVVHARPDTYRAEPDAGPRVACGVIARPE